MEEVFGRLEEERKKEKKEKKKNRRGRNRNVDRELKEMSRLVQEVRREVEKREDDEGMHLIGGKIPFTEYNSSVAITVSIPSPQICNILSIYPRV